MSLWDLSPECGAGLPGRWVGTPAEADFSPLSTHELGGQLDSNRLTSLQAAVVKGKQHIIVDGLTAHCVKYKEVFQENPAVLCSFRTVNVSKSDRVFYLF